MLPNYVKGRVLPPFFMFFSVTSSFAELRDESDLLDATVICEGQTVRAHKLVLSACSGVFRQLFRSKTSCNLADFLLFSLPRVFFTLFKDIWNTTTINFIIFIHRQKFWQMAIKLEGLHLRPCMNFCRSPRRWISLSQNFTNKTKQSHANSNAA